MFKVYGLLKDLRSIDHTFPGLFGYRLAAISGAAQFRTRWLHPDSADTATESFGGGCARTRFRV